MCDCDEGFIQRAHVRHGEAMPEIRAPLVHDCKYIAARNTMIPAAAKYAEMMTLHLEGDAKAIVLGFHFFREMERRWALHKERLACAS
jgi:hypothetical protein